MLNPETYQPAEPPIEFWETHGWHYRTRYLIARDLDSRVKELIDSENPENIRKIENFSKLLSIPPFIRDAIKQNPQEWDELFNASLPGLYRLQYGVSI